MGKNRFGWHSKIRTAAVLSFSGLIITGCSLVPREPAPVYMLGATSTPTRPSMASAPMKRAMIAPGAPAPKPEGFGRFLFHSFRHFIIAAVPPALFLARNRYEEVGNYAPGGPHAADGSGTAASTVGCSRGPRGPKSFHAGEIDRANFYSKGRSNGL